MDSHGTIELRMDGDDPYIGFEEFSALEYLKNLGGEDLLAIEEEEDLEGVGEGQGEEGEGYEERQHEQQNGRESEEDEAAIWDTVQPCVGMEFMSADKAYNFYNAYAGHVGFSIRRNTRTKSRNGLSSVRLVCSKEGFSKRQIAEQKRGSESSKSVKSPEREYETTRTGCKECLRVKLVKGGVWKVTVFMDDHNHNLIRSPSKNRNLQSQKCIIAEDKEIIMDLSAQNIGTSQILEYIAVKRGRKRKLTFKKKDVSNQIASHNARGEIKDHHVLNLLLRPLLNNEENVAIATQRRLIILQHVPSAYKILLRERNNKRTSFGLNIYLFINLILYLDYFVTFQCVYLLAYNYICLLSLLPVIFV